MMTVSYTQLSIRPGWFWHEKEEPHSLERLFQVYLNSVGANCCLNLNLPPNRDGLMDVRDVQRLRELGALLDRELGHPIPARTGRRENGFPTQPAVSYTHLDNTTDGEYKKRDHCL